MLKNLQNDKYSSSKSNKWIIISLWLIAIIAMAFLILTSNYPEQESRQPKGQDYSTEIKHDEHGLGIGTTEFFSQFNTAAIKFNSELKMLPIKIQPGIAQDTFRCTISKNITIIGIIDNDGNLLSVTLLGFSDGTLSSNTEIAQALGILILALDPDLSIKDCYLIAKELGLADNKLSIPSQINSHGKHYFSMKSDESNLMIIISKSPN